MNATSAATRRPVAVRPPPRPPPPPPPAPPQDPYSRRAAWATLQEAKAEGRIILYSSHFLDEVRNRRGVEVEMGAKPV